MPLRRPGRVQESDDGGEDEAVHHEESGENDVGERRQEVGTPLPPDDGEELPHDGASSDSDSVEAGVIAASGSS